MLIAVHSIFDNTWEKKAHVINSRKHLNILLTSFDFVVPTEFRFGQLIIQILTEENQQVKHILIN
jgi:hypothetical protein